MEPRDEKKIQLCKFQSILDFVSDLYEVVGNSQHSITLYYRLITKTQVSDNDILQRHIKCFTEFCRKNTDAIKGADDSKLVTPRIEFTDRIYIDIQYLCKKLSETDQKAIWNHLRSIKAVMEDDNIVSRIMEQQDAQSEGGRNVIADLMSTLQEEVDLSQLEMTSNPMEMVMKLMSSGIVDNVVGKFQQKLNSGEIDLGEIMSAAHSMTQSIQKDMQNDPDPVLQGMLSSLSESFPMNDK